MTAPIHARPTPAEDLRKWCDRLVEPRRHRLERDTGRSEWLTLPPLLKQLEADLGETGTGSTGRSKPGSRPPLNVNVLSLLGCMAEVIGEAVRNEPGLTKRLTPKGDFDLASNLRQLALHLAADLADAPDDLAWWSRLLRGWVGEAESMLPNGDDGPATRPLRGVECPTCRTWTIQRVQDGETFRDPALVLVFRDGWVHYALCKACGENWWRGDPLLALADSQPGLRRTA